MHSYLRYNPKQYYFYFISSFFRCIFNLKTVLAIIAAFVAFVQLRFLKLSLSVACTKTSFINMTRDAAVTVLIKHAVARAFTGITARITLRVYHINSSESRGNYSARSNNMKLVHWPSMGGLLHLVQRGGDWEGPQPAQAPPHCTKCNSPPINGTVPTSHYLM